MAYHLLGDPTDVSSVHVWPLSALVQMFPPLALFPPSVAANLVPSEELVMARHLLGDPTDVSSVHVAPLSALVQRFPPNTAAANFVQSEELVMACQYLVAPTEVTSVHGAPPSALRLTAPFVSLARAVKEPVVFCHSQSDPVSWTLLGLGPFGISDLSTPPELAGLTKKDKKPLNDRPANWGPN